MVALNLVVLVFDSHKGVDCCDAKMLQVHETDMAGLVAEVRLKSTLPCLMGIFDITKTSITGPLSSGMIGVV